MAVKTPDLFSSHSGCIEADQTKSQGVLGLGSSTGCLSNEDFSRLLIQTFRITSMTQCKPLSQGKKQDTRCQNLRRVVLQKAPGKQCHFDPWKAEKCPGHNLPRRCLGEKMAWLSGNWGLLIQLPRTDFGPATHQVWQFPMVDGRWGAELCSRSALPPPGSGLALTACFDDGL